MTQRELRRVEVLARVKSKELKVANVASLLGVSCRLGEEETIWAAANRLRTWIEKHGVPQVLYVD
jgi:hypothetical protein